MNFASIVQVAMRALARNKMRSVLTMLGIIIGVGAVIAMVGIGEGAQVEIQARIQAMGSNLLFVGAGTVNRNGQHLGWGSTKTLKQGDVDAILRECPAVAAAAPGAQNSQQVVYENQNWFTSVQGTTPPYFKIRNWTFNDGVPFTNDDVQRAADVAVLGNTVVQNLFGNTDPIGKTIRIGSLPFIVVGTLASRGQSGMGHDQDDTIMVPITTFQKKISGQDWDQWIVVSAVSQNATYAAQQEINSLLLDRHRIRRGEDPDFFVHNLTDRIQLADQSARIMTLLLASIAGVSLIVGGIGIMNIMLVSVTERTREIGIRMAIGATEEDVQRQFLIEALVISLLGGAIGIVVGGAASFIISDVLHWAIMISPVAVGGAVAFSGAVGVFFGFYPARKAATLDPIEALRFE
jgi:putative ABC transport system permease protein